MATESARTGIGTASSSASHAEAVLAAYEGYWELVEAGKEVNLEAYCGQFPALRSSLSSLLRAHDLVDNHLDALQSGPEAAAVAWPQPGDAFLDYDLRCELGRGAFSRVYLATQHALGDRWVVLKLYKRPMGEARILGPLAHPNIVPINSLQIEPTRKLGVICMPCLGSSTLQRLLDLIGETGVPIRADAILRAAVDTNLPQKCRELLASTAPVDILRRGTYVEGVCHLGLHLADALAFIHKRGICHRDLKPSNVLLRPDGQPMLLDFNLSNEVDRPSLRMGGTLPYMSPEQLQAWWVCHEAAADDSAPEAEDCDTNSLEASDTTPSICPTVSAQADIFSMGVMLYELLAGANPFGPIPVEISATELYRLLSERQQQGFKPLREANPAVDARLAALIESCLELDPQNRPATADVLAKGLRERLSLGWRRWLARGTWVLVAVCLFFATVGIGGAFVLHRDPLQEAIALRDKGDDDRAIDRLTEILHKDPRNFEARFMRARLYQKLSELERRTIGNALEDYRQLELLRSDARVKACMGYCRQKINHNGKRGELEGAIESYEAALNLQFDNQRIRNNLGRAYAQCAELDQALKQFDVALSFNSNAPVVLHNRASIAANLFFKHKDESYLYRGIADVQQALQFGATADLHMVGARLHALAARRDPERNIIPALQHLQNAIILGSPPPLFDDSSFKALKSVRQFEHLTSQKPAVNLKPMPRILDPLIEPN